jgi:hypothetical protein
MAQHGEISYDDYTDLCVMQAFECDDDELAGESIRHIDASGVYGGVQ